MEFAAAQKAKMSVHLRSRPLAKPVARFGILNGRIHGFKEIILCSKITVPSGGTAPKRLFSADQDDNCRFMHTAPSAPA